MDQLEFLYPQNNPNVGEFVKDPPSDNIYKLNSTKSYAVIKDGKIVALVLRKLMPKNIIDNFKNTQFIYKDPTRGSAGVTFSPHAEKLKKEFHRLQSTSMELSSAGKYIFLNANIDGRKDIIYDVTKQHDGVLTGFKVFTALENWSSSSLNLSKEQNEIIKMVPESKLSGTLKGQKYYYQKKDNETIYAEVDIKSRTNFDRTVLSVYYGSTPCYQSKAANSNKALKINNEAVSSLKKCTPSSFGNCGIINDIRILANNIFKSLDHHSANYDKLSSMLSAHKESVNELASWCDKGYFSNITLNFTYPDKPTTNFHKDVNVNSQNLAALFVTGTEYTGGETALPDLLVDNKVLAVDMKEGDFMLFQSKDFLHGNLAVKQSFSVNNTSISEHAHHSENRRSLVFYLDSRFDHCDHFNKNEFDGIHQKLSLRLLKPKKTLRKENLENLENQLLIKGKKISIKELPKKVENKIIIEKSNAAEPQEKFNWYQAYLNQQTQLCPQTEEKNLSIYENIQLQPQPPYFLNAYNLHPNYQQIQQSIAQANELKRERPFDSSKDEMKKMKF
ncbi:MAG: hypothetical protein H0V82_13005 [Candidatus Protochlamydia sp.]|nr:hypothetical protein [Candidatus Protochlamydia sp.]